MAHKDRGWTTYTNFASVAVSIKCLENTATQNGTAFAQAPPQNVFWADHTANLRHVYGSDSTNTHKDSMVAMNISSPIWAIGAGWQDSDGNAYNTTGLRNERIAFRNIK